MGYVFMQIALSYFLADFTVCLSDKVLRDDKASILHHLLGVTSASIGLYCQERLMYFIVLFATGEV